MRRAMARRIPRNASAGPASATFGGPLDVGTCDGAAGSGGLYGVEIDVERVCESTHRRKHLKHSRRCRLGRSLGHSSLLLAGVELAD